MSSTWRWTHEWFLIQQIFWLRLRIRVLHLFLPYASSLGKEMALVLADPFPAVSVLNFLVACPSSGSEYFLTAAEITEQLPWSTTSPSDYRTHRSTTCTLQLYIDFSCTSSCWSWSCTEIKSKSSHLSFISSLFMIWKCKKVPGEYGSRVTAVTVKILHGTSEFSIRVANHIEDWRKKTRSNRSSICILYFVFDIICSVFCIWQNSLY